MFEGKEVTVNGGGVAKTKVCGDIDVPILVGGEDGEEDDELCCQFTMEEEVEAADFRHVVGP